MTAPDQPGMTPELQDEIARALANSTSRDKSTDTRLWDLLDFSGENAAHLVMSGAVDAIAPIIARLVAEAWEGAAKVADVQAAREIFEDRRGFCKATARDIATAIRARKPQP